MSSIKINIPKSIKGIDQLEKRYRSIAMMSNTKTEKDKLNQFSKSVLVQFAKTWFKMNLSEMSKASVIAVLPMRSNVLPLSSC